MEKEETRKGEGAGGSNFEGFGNCCGSMPVTEEKSKMFMDCGSSACIPDDMGKMWKDKASGKSITEKMKSFFRTEKPKA